MKKFNTLRTITAAVWTGLLAFTAVFPSIARAQGTAFNFQGRLMDNGVAANGVYDFVFTVHDALAGGNALGVPVPINALAVSAGQFVAPLDFGAGVFSGAARWLEIRMRLNGAQTFTTLAPRQSLLPTPYAIFANSAGGVASGTVTANQLNTVGPAPTPGQFLSYDGGNLAWTAPGVAAGNIWSLNGSTAYYNAGRVGIGTATPGFKFVVADAGIAQLGFSPTYGIRSGYLGGSGSELDGGDLQLQGSWSLYNGGRIRLGGSGRGDTDRNVVQFFQNNLERMRINDGGNVGIGTASPLTKLHLYDAVNSVSHLIETGGGINSWAQVRYKNANGVWIAGTSRGFNGDQFYFSREGSTTGNAFAIQPNGDAYVQGTMSCKVLTIRGGADVAEPFRMPEDIAKGSVVVIDDAHPGQLKLSTEAYDKRVAGIVSGANGVNPGIALHQEGVMEGGQNVALSGRVYVQADGAYGAIKPGDLLTTSKTPGHAMKVSDHSIAQGAILGKAMSGLKEGKGMVLVLVTLQ